MSIRRVAIVTGASSGIGRALAERAVRAGWDVFAVGRRAERLRELETLVASSLGSLTTLALDLRDPGAAARIVRETLAAYGRIDVLVNNAGGVAVGDISNQSDAALYEQMETHVIVPLALTREALPSLRASRGGVIFFGSGVARIPVGTLGAYPAAKAAVRSLARTARNELRSAGIAVTYVDPGAVATEFMTRVGFAGPPPSVAASPYDVARAVFAAFTSRRAVVNAVPWQTFFVALGEAFPKITDFVLARAPGIVGGDVLPPPIPEKPVLPAATIASNEREVGTPSALGLVLDRALPEPASPTAEHESHGESYEAGSDPDRHVTQSAADDSNERGDVSNEAPHSPEPVTPEEPVPVGPKTFEAALEAHEHRMKKMNLRAPFVRALLVPGTELDTGYVAMRWAGMPNKNERGLTSEVLGALAEAGFLERLDDERFRVVRSGEE